MAAGGRRAGDPMEGVGREIIPAMLDRDGVLSAVKVCASVAAATAAVFWGLVVIDTAWAQVVAVLTAGLVVTSSMLWLYYQVRLIRWSDDPRCPSWVKVQYQPAVEFFKPKGMLYRLRLVNPPGQLRGLEIFCNTAPVGEIESALRITNRRGSVFVIPIRGDDRHYDFVVRSPQKSIQVLKIAPVMPTTPWWKVWAKVSKPDPSTGPPLPTVPAPAPPSSPESS
jgi:hypothetical protein